MVAKPKVPSLPTPETEEVDAVPDRRENEEALLDLNEKTGTVNMAANIHVRGSWCIVSVACSK